MRIKIKENFRQDNCLPSIIILSCTFISSIFLVFSTYHFNIGFKADIRALRLWSNMDVEVAFLCVREKRFT